METRVLGTDLTVSAVGLGCMGFSHAYGAPLPKEEAISAIRTAFQIGYTFFDTAEVYGTPENLHENEMIVGEALKPIRDKVQISTKFGIRFDDISKGVKHEVITDSRPETIYSSIEGSLQRLQTDHIDLYLQHRIDPNVEPEVVAGVMADLIKQGKILHWGISEVTEDYLRRAHKVCPVTAIQNRYSLMYRDYERLLPVLDELHIGFMAFAPLANGLLSGKYDKSSQATFDSSYDFRADMVQFRSESFDTNQQLLRLIREVSTKKGCTEAQLSMAYLMAKRPYIVPIPGSRHIERIKENAGAASVHLTPAELDELAKAISVVPMSSIFGRKY